MEPPKARYSCSRKLITFPRERGFTVFEKAKIIRAVMTVSWRAMTNLCDGKRHKHVPSSFPQHFFNLEWIDQIVGKKLTDSRKAKCNQTRSAFQTNHLSHIVSNNNSQQSLAGSLMGLNEVGKGKVLTTLTKGWS